MGARPNGRRSLESVAVLTSSPRSSRVRRALLLLAVAGGLAGASGCGTTGEPDAGVRVLVTTDDGAKVLVDETKVEVKDEESVLAVLRRTAKGVETTPAGRAVTAIDGRAAEGGATWSFWVNGVSLRSGGLLKNQDVNLQQPPVVETPQTAKVYNGDTIWFDLRPNAKVGTPRGVVGTFPEPFLHGAEGKRWPLRVECAAPREQACRQVRDAMTRYEIPVSTNLLRTSYNPESARIAVGTWDKMREDPAAQLAERGPGASGVWAVPAKNGRTIDLLDGPGKVVDTLGPGTGLIFASRYRDEPPSWIVTGTDEAGVLQAAGALDEQTLQRHFAVAVRGGTVTPLPVAKAAGR